MEEDIKILEEKINKDYKDMIAVINSTSLPLFVEDTIEDMHILIEHLIARYKELESELYCANNMISDQIDLLRDSLPKSKVKEKIEEIENTGIDVAWEQVNYAIREQDRAKIEVLQELLED